MEIEPFEDNILTVRVDNSQERRLVRKAFRDASPEIQGSAHTRADSLSGRQQILHLLEDQVRYLGEYAAKEAVSSGASEDGIETALHVVEATRQFSHTDQAARE